MALHDQIHQLTQDLGRHVFSDSDELRAALDDYLAEGAATAGEINLLVDAVRLGAFEQLQRMLAEGASPPAAVGQAGERLAYNRGSTDRDGASWACAVLGYAAGLLPESEVLRYRTTLRQPWQTPEADSGSVWPQVPPATEPPPPATEPPLPAAEPPPPPGYPETQHARGAFSPAPPTSRRRGWWVAVAVLLIVALAGGGVVWALGSDESGSQGALNGDESTGPTEPVTPSTTAPTTTAPTTTAPTTTAPTTTQPSTTQPSTPRNGSDSVRAGVTRTLRGYLDAINDGDYDRAMSWVDTESEIRETPEEQWQDDFATTFDDRLDVRSVREAGDMVKVHAMFRSQQAAGYGPEGAEDATCLLWSIDYEMALVEDQYVISEASGRGDPPWTRCD